MSVHDWVLKNCKIVATFDCIIWPHHVSNSGYGKFTHQNRTFYAHRYVCEMQNGPPPKGMDAAHQCGNSLCVNPLHLAWKTRKSNIADKLLHGSQTFGETHTPAKLTELQASSILKDPRTHSEIAKYYPVCRQTISRIKSGEIWSHLQERRVLT